jgi:hypothetical protein
MLISSDVRELAQLPTMDLQNCVMYCFFASCTHVFHIMIMQNPHGAFHEAAISLKSNCKKNFSNIAVELDTWCFAGYAFHSQHFWCWVGFSTLSKVDQPVTSKNLLPPNIKRCCPEYLFEATTFCITAMYMILQMHHNYTTSLCK